MARLHGGKMHPEFHRRFFSYIESKNGLLGVGGGWRDVQPVKPGFAPPGKSFHESQRFGSGFFGYAAVDLVVPRGHGLVHRAPTWGETGDAPSFGLHTFIRSPKPEPWHIQCLEMRGFDSWVAAGRPDPQPPVTPILVEDDEDMAVITYIAQPPAGSPSDSPWLYVFNGTVRYATNRDTAIPGIEFVVLNADQYPKMVKSAGL